MEIQKMFLYNNKITFIGSYNFQDYPNPNGWRIQPPLIYSIQPGGIYNSLYSPPPTGRRLQPPFLSPTFHSQIYNRNNLKFANL
jgi:hypothetical protein